LYATLKTIRRQTLPIRLLRRRERGHQPEEISQEVSSVFDVRRRCDAEPLQMISKELAADVESVAKFGYEPTV
jgi:hypothetical protein